MWMLHSHTENHKQNKCVLISNKNNIHALLVYKVVHVC